MNIRSYAKINWTLDVLYRREDGYHEIRTIFQTVSLYDRLKLTLTDGDIEVSCTEERVPCDETNLAYRAAAMLREAAGVRHGARIEINKRIPVAAGMGGGSSNAAAALMGLARLWRIEGGEALLYELAARLGSDVPYFLLGGTALGIGRGEEVYPLEEAACAHLVLANPGVAVSTAEAYGKLARLTRQGPVRIMPFTFLAAKGIHGLPLAVRNDLEEVVLSAHPEIAELKRRLIELGARSALMSGSGATVFGVFENSSTSQHASEALGESGYWAVTARAINRQEYSDTLFM